MRQEASKWNLVWRLRLNDNSTKPLQTKMIAYWRNKLELKTMSFMVISPFLNRYPVLVTTKRSLATITALWVVGILEGVTPNLIKEIIGKEGHALLELAYGCPRSSLIPREARIQPIMPHYLTLLAIVILVPSGIMLVSHAWIFMISFRQYRRIRTLEDAFSRRHVTELRAAKTVAVIVFSALACFVPVLAVTLITTFEPPSGNSLNAGERIVKFRLFPSLKILYLLAISFNPLIYALKSEPFRQAIKRTIRPRRAICRPNPPGNKFNEELAVRN